MIYTALENGKPSFIKTKLLLLLVVNIDYVFSSASNRIIHAKDHSSIQLNIAQLDPDTGRITEKSKMYAICGSIRRMVIFSIFFFQISPELLIQLIYLINLFIRVNQMIVSQG